MKIASVVARPAALRTVAEGGHAFDPRHPKGAPGRAALSPREREVLRLVAGGATNREVAAALQVGGETVKTLVARTFVKLGVVILLGIGVLFVRPQLQLPAFTRFVDGTGPIFAGKILFIVHPPSFSVWMSGAMIAVSSCCPVCTITTALTMTTSHTYSRSCSHTYPGAVGICYGVPLWLCAGAFLTAGLVVGGRSVGNPCRR